MFSAVSLTTTVYVRSALKQKFILLCVEKKKIQYITKPT